MITVHLQPLKNLHWRVVRVVEGARLESVYTSKGYRGFESLTLRKKGNKFQAGCPFSFNSKVAAQIRMFLLSQQTLWPAINRGTCSLQPHSYV
jgi:hypothetical protein